MRRYSRNSLHTSFAIYTDVDQCRLTCMKKRRESSVGETPRLKATAQATSPRPKNRVKNKASQGW